MHLSIISFYLIVKCLIVIALVVTILYWAGWVILRATSGDLKDSWATAFTALVLGLVSIVSIYAIVVTKGRTVLFLCPALVIVFGLIVRPTVKAPSNKRLPWRNYGLLLLMVVTSLVAFLPNFISIASDRVKFLGDDQTFYATLATYLNTYRLENVFPDFFGISHFGVVPYHYGDIWLHALLARATGMNTSVVLALISYPVMIVILGAGISAITEAVFPALVINWWRVILLPVVIIIASGFTFLYPSFVVDWNRYDNSFYNIPKYLVPGIFIIWTFLFYYRKSYFAFSAAVALASFFFLTFSIPLVIAACILILISCIKKELSLKDTAVCASSLMLAWIYPFVFYKLFSIAPDDQLYKSEYRLFAVSDFKQGVIGLAVGDVAHLCCYLAQALFIYLLYRQYKTKFKAAASQFANAKHILLFVAALFISGYIGMVGTYNRTLDYWQLYAQVMIPTINSAIVVMFLVASSKYISKPLQILALLALAINFRDSYMVEGKGRVNGRFSSNGQEYNKALAFIKEAKPRFAEITKIDSNEAHLYSAHTHVLKHMYFLSYHFDPYINVSINTPVIPTGRVPRIKFLRESIINIAPFSTYYAQHNGSIENLTQLQLSYLRANRIHYLLSSLTEKLSPALSQYVTDSISLPENDLRISHISL